jgi:hypothetical protein
MTRITLWLGLLLLTLAVFLVSVGWYGAWRDHRKEVERQRFVWGPNAPIPEFDPAVLFLPGKMSDDTAASYMLAGPFALAGFLSVSFFAGAKHIGKRKGA